MTEAIEKSVINIKLNLFKPYRQQAEVLEALANPLNFYTTVVSGRQVGKSTLSQNIAIKWALDAINVLVYWVSPSSTQALKSLNDIVKALGYNGVKSSSKRKKVSLITAVKRQKDDAQIQFVNGSVIKFKSAGSEERLKGDTVHYCIIDEAASIKENTVNEMILPMLTAAGRKMLCVGTPKGRSNWLYGVYHKGINDATGRYRSFSFPSHSSPFASLETINDAFYRLPYKIFQQEYLAQFVEGAAVFDNIVEQLVLKKFKGCGDGRVYTKEDNNDNEHRDGCHPEEGKKYFAGVDIGMKNDYTVASIFEFDRGRNVYKLIHYYRVTNISADQIVKLLIRIINKWNCRMMIETNNQGQPIIDHLKKEIEPTKRSRLIEFTTTNKSKSEIIEDLIYCFSTKTIELVNDGDLRIELENFIWEHTATGLTKYFAASGHDDIVMSTAIGLHCAIKNKNTGVAITSAA